MPEVAPGAGEQSHQLVDRRLERLPEARGALLGRRAPQLGRGERTLAPPIDELMRHFARAWQQLGSLLAERFGGEALALVASAAGRAERLVALLAEMPLYRDVARYDGFDVPFYKRAQLTCADLAAAFAERGPGAFSDLASLTIFADNLVPHVLRVEGALQYAPELLARIEADRTSRQKW